MSRVVLLSRAADLTPGQRMMLLALRKEAIQPTVRMRLGYLTSLLLLAAVIGLMLGVVIR